MASTVSDSGGDRYRAAQRRISLGLFRDMRRLRRLITASRLQSSLPVWIDAVRALVGEYGNASGALAADFYDAQRAAAGVAGQFSVSPSESLPVGQVDNSLRWATSDLWPRDPQGSTITEAQRAPIDRRLETAMAKADAVAQKLVADQGRETVREAVRQDRGAVGYARAAALGACAFCRLMASRGMVYKTADSAGRDADSQFSGDASVVKFHDNCVPAGTLVDGPAAEVGYRRWYEGEMLVIGTSGGHKLSITPNHPVLTDGGWVPAGLLRPGDHIFSSLNAQGSLLAVPDEEHVPARIEDVWGALSVLGLVGVPVAPEDFHGDGTDGEVDVVRANGLLRRHLDPVDVEVLREVELALAGVRESLLAASCSPEEFFGGDLAVAHGVMGGLGQAETFLLAHLGQPVHLGSASTSNRGVSVGQDMPDRGARNSEAIREGEFTLALQVCRGDIKDREFGSRGPGFDVALTQLATEHGGRYAARSPDLAAALAADVQRDRTVENGGRGPVGAVRFDPPVLYGSMDGPGAYARLGRDLAERLAGRVERDCVVDVRRTEFAGHVYNLQTAQGWYRADGVIVSNCHCGIIPVFRGQRFELSAHAAEWDRIYREFAAPFPGDQLRRFRRAIAEHG